MPLPQSGEWSFTLSGTLTIRDVTRDVTWEARAKRNGGELAGSARIAFPFATFGLEIPRVASVLSVTDEIRVEVEVVARQVAD